MIKNREYLRDNLIAALWSLTCSVFVSVPVMSACNGDDKIFSQTQTNPSCGTPGSALNIFYCIKIGETILELLPSK